MVVGAGMGGLGLMILFVGCLSTGDTRNKVYRTWRGRVGGRISCAIVSCLVESFFYLSVNLFFICVIQFQDGRSCKFRGGGPLGGLVVPFGLGFSPFLNYGLCRHTCFGHALYLTFLIRWESRLYPLFFLSVHGYHIPVVFGLVADVRCYHHCYPVLYSCMVAVSVYPSEWLYRLQSV